MLLYNNENDNQSYFELKKEKNYYLGLGHTLRGESKKEL